MRYYWLKIKRDFLKRHDVSLLLGKYGGDGYLIYQWLMLESIDHEGELRFSDELPYTAEDISALTGVDGALTEEVLLYLNEKKMAYRANDGTIIVPYVQENVGSETASAERMRRYRESKIEQKDNKTKKQSDNKVAQSDDKVQKSNTEKEKKKEIKKDTKEEFINKWFEEVWKEYPNKKGKGQIKKSHKEKAYKIKDEFDRALRRYKNETHGREQQYIMYGSTFFKSGYIDYLDDNYEPSDGVALIEEERKKKEQKRQQAEERERRLLEEEKRKTDAEFKKKYPQYAGMTHEQIQAEIKKNLGRVKTL